MATRASQYHEHGGESRNGDEFRPYFFRRDPSDAFAEAFRELLRLKLTEGASVPATPAPPQVRRPTHEAEAIREQRRTLFAFDPAMQRMFQGDVDAFCAAMDDPGMFAAVVDAYYRAHEERRDRRMHGSSSGGSGRVSWMLHRGAPSPWESSDGDPDGAAHQHGDDAMSLGDDPLYHEAFRWGCRVARWAQRAYAAAEERDGDAFRIATNAMLVPAKIAFGFSAALDDDLAGLEVAAAGYRQAAIFLMRILESLRSAYGKRSGRSETIHELLDAGHELLADVETQLAEIESEIRHRNQVDHSP